MGARRTRRTRGKTREGVWGGIQFGITNVPIAGILEDLAYNLGTEERDRTCVGIRGSLFLANSGSDAVNGPVIAAVKVLKVNLNDALVITDDVQAFDTQLEDIQQRQLWTHFTNFALAGTRNTHQFEQIEIDIRVKIKLEARSKISFEFLVDASVVNRLQMAGYLRAYYKF